MLGAFGTMEARSDAAGARSSAWYAFGTQRPEGKNVDRQVVDTAHALLRLRGCKSLYNELVNIKGSDACRASGSTSGGSG